MDTFNLAAYDPTQAELDLYLRPHFANQPKVNFGAAKVVARFKQLALTRKGSDRTDPAAGCGLIDMIAQRHTSELDYLQREVNDIVRDLTVQMGYENDPDTPLESQLLDAYCDRLETQADSLILYFTLITRTETPIQFQLPISIV